LTQQKKAVRAFGSGDQVDAVVTLNKPNKWACSGIAMGTVSISSLQSFFFKKLKKRIKS